VRARTALVTGIAGQDGTYLAELLLVKGYRVFGTSRDPALARKSLPQSLVGRIDVLKWDPTDLGAMVEILSSHRPEELYNLAAMSSGAGMFDAAVAIGEVNGLSVARILEAICHTSPTTRLCQASSSEIFGLATDSPQSEETPIRPRSPYGAAKAYADMMVRIYRRHHGLFACSAILFNHESPRRGLAFVSRKVAQGAAMVKRGQSKYLTLGNLDSTRDWGYAGDFVRALWLMLQQRVADDYVIATGVQHSVRDLCDHAFGQLGLNYRDYVRAEESAFRPSEGVPLLGNPAKAAGNLGWQPEVGFRELVDMMVEAEMQRAGDRGTEGAVG
jgi:GDPmannose 4,6-dehydratase